MSRQCAKSSDYRPANHLIVWIPAIVLCLGSFLWWLIASRTHFQLEDAFITFRYSANIISGEGFVFSAGERVLGTTTPLQTLLLAVIGYPFGPHAVDSVALVVMPVFGILAGLAAYVVLTKRGISVVSASAAMALIFAHLSIIRIGIGGMETPIVLLLMALSLWALIEDRPVLTGIVLGLLVLTRIDGLIWASLIFMTGFIKWRIGALKQIVAFGIVLLPWIIFATLYFGSPIPNSMIAKGTVRPGLENVLLDTGRIMQYTRWFVKGLGIQWDSLFMPVWLIVIGVGAWRVTRGKSKELALLAIFPPYYALVMYAGRAPRYEWYLIPMTFTALMLGAVGVCETLRWLGMRVFRLPQKIAISLAVALAVLSIGCYSSQGVPTIIRRLKMSQENEDMLRTSVGRWLKNNTPENSTVAMEAIGYQGYYSGRRIIDNAGLVTPKVVEYKKSTGSNAEVFGLILSDQKPDYLVLRSFEVDTNRHFNGGPLFKTPEKEAEFRRNYREVKRFVAPYPGSAPLVRHLTVYQRVQNPLNSSEN